MLTATCKAASPSNIVCRKVVFNAYLCCSRIRASRRLRIINFCKFARTSVKPSRCNSSVSASSHNSKLEKQALRPHNPRIVVIPAIWRRFGRGFDSRHLHLSVFFSVRLVGGDLVSTGRAKESRQLVRRSTLMKQIHNCQ